MEGVDGCLQIDSTIYANLHNNPKSSLVPTALSINHQVHRNVNIRPAIKDGTIEHCYGSYMK